LSLCATPKLACPPLADLGVIDSAKNSYFLKFAKVLKIK